MNLRILRQCHERASATRRRFVLRPAFSPIRRIDYVQQFAFTQARLFTEQKSDVHDHAVLAEAYVLPNGPSVQKTRSGAWNLGSETPSIPRRPGPLPQGAFALESFLPRHLRMHQQAYRLEINTAKPFDIIKLPTVLSSARTAIDADSIARLAIDEGRWPAASYLLDALLDRYHKDRQELAKTPEEVLSRESDLPSLDELTQRPIRVSRLHKIPRTSNVRLSKSRRLHRSQQSHRKLLGCLWQTLGAMLIRSEDFPPHDPLRRSIMAFVLEIIARAHHLSIIPASVYQCRSFSEFAPCKRPQTLELLSLRIHAVLSDAAWKKHWIGEMRQAQKDGYLLDPPRLQPHLSDLGAHIWIDLILWICIDTGYIIEAAWIIRELEKRKDDPATRWSVINWADVQKTNIQKPSLGTILKAELSRSRLNQCAGFGIAAPGDHYLLIPTRTISREAVQTVCDGIVNLVRDNQALGKRALPDCNDYTLICLKLLHRSSRPLDQEEFGLAMLRMAEADDLHSVSNRRAHSSVMGFLEHMSLGAKSEALEASDGIRKTHSAALLGLLHGALAEYSNSQDYWSCLQVLRVIQNIVDANRTARLADFAKKLDRMSSRDESIQEESISAEGRLQQVLHPQIPAHTVARILDLITENNLHSVGYWLVSNDEVDGGIIPQSMFNNVALQPALLRFAASIGDHSMLQRFLELLQPPLDVSVQRALLQCQIIAGRWTAVEKILTYLRDDAEVGWAPADAAVVASFILANSKADTYSNGLERAAVILRSMLEGLYDPPTNPANGKDRSFQLMSMSLRRLLATIPNDALQYALEVSTAPLPSATKVVPVEAFNVILKTVVDHYGPALGQALWDRWCLTSTIDTSTTLHKESQALLSGGDDGTRSVNPDLASIRTVIRPLVTLIRDNQQKYTIRYSYGSSQTTSEMIAGINVARVSSGERQLINWAVPRMQALGIDAHQIRAEMHGDLTANVQPLTSADSEG